MSLITKNTDQSLNSIGDIYLDLCSRKLQTYDNDELVLHILDAMNNESDSFEIKIKKEDPLKTMNEEKYQIFGQFKVHYNKFSSKLPYPTSKSFAGISTKIDGMHAIDTGGVTNSLVQCCVDYLLETYFDSTLNSEYFIFKGIENTKLTKGIENDLTILGYFLAYMFENGITRNFRFPTPLMHMCLNNINDATSPQLMACTLVDFSEEKLNMYFNKDLGALVEGTTPLEFLKGYNDFKVPIEAYKCIAKGFKNTTVYKTINDARRKPEGPWDVSAMELSSQLFSGAFDLNKFADFLSEKVTYSGFVPNIREKKKP